MNGDAKKAKAVKLGVQASKRAALQVKLRAGAPVRVGREGNPIPQLVPTRTNRTPGGGSTPCPAGTQRLSDGSCFAVTDTRRSQFQVGTMAGRNDFLTNAQRNQLELGPLAQAGCDFVPEGRARDLCLQLAGLIPGGGDDASTPLQEATCPPGTVRVGTRCVAPGDVFPGGDPFIFGAGGQAVVGAFGLPALTPTQVGTVYGRPVLRCPTGMVLGKDDLCYPRQLLGRRGQFRKHKAPRKPVMTGADAAALRRIGTLQAKVKQLAGTAGFACVKKGGASRRRK